MDYSNWSDKPEHLDENMVRLYERFLLGTLATGASKMSDGFISELGISSSLLAESYLTKLSGESFSFDFKDSAADVEKAVAEFKCSPWDEGLDPYFIATRTEKDETVKQIKSLTEYREVKNTGLGEEATPLIKRRFIEVDSVYRHLRNALAHGCFRVLTESSPANEKLFFYDVDRNDAVSCCALVSVAMLDDWYQVACDIAKKKL